MDAIEPDNLHAQVARICDAGALREGSRQHRLLRYLLDAEVSNKGASLKAYAIAIDVLGRGEDFDPGTDSIVRVEIGRLRKTLDAYFDGPGAADPYHLRLPRGGMRLAIIDMAAGSDADPFGPSVRAASPDAGADPRPTPLRGPWPGLLQRRPILALTGIAALALVLLWMLPALNARIAPSPAISAITPPVIEVAPFDNELARTELGYLAPGIRSELQHRLAHFRALRVLFARPVAAGPSPVRADFRLRGRVFRAHDNLVIALVLIDTRSGLATHTIHLPVPLDTGDFHRMVSDQIATAVQTIAAPGGSLQSSALERIRAAEAAGASPQQLGAYGCVIRWKAYDLSKDPALEPTARACLKHYVASDTRDGEVWAAFALMTFLDWSRSGGSVFAADLARAERAARKAIRLAPGSSKGHEYLGSILMVQGRYSESFRSLRRAASLNPSDPGISAVLGWGLTMRGQWDKGLEHVNRAIVRSVQVPGFYRVPLSIDAFRRGDFDAALAQARLIAASGDRRGAILGLAAAYEAELPGLVMRYRERLEAEGMTPREALDELAAQFVNPDVIALYRQTLDRMDQV